MVVKARDGRNVYGWHGLTGMGVYALSMATVVSGFNALLPDSPSWRVIVSVRGSSCIGDIFVALGATGIDWEPVSHFLVQILVPLTALMALSIVLFRPSKRVLSDQRPNRNHSTIRELVDGAEEPLVVG